MVEYEWYQSVIVMFDVFFLLIKFILFTAALTIYNDFFLIFILFKQILGFFWFSHEIFLTKIAYYKLIFETIEPSIEHGITNVFVTDEL